jgi:hypothetical protein
VFRKLALQKESRIKQGHLMPDHVSDPTAASIGPISKDPM